MLLHFVTLTFDLILIDGRGIVMDYPCVKLGDFGFSRFGFIMLTDTQTVVGLSNDNNPTRGHS